MEFPNLGNSCKVTTCKTLDFLPFICKHCELVFCKDHFNPTFHDCKPYTDEVKSKNLTNDQLNVVEKIPCFLCEKKFASIEIINCNECKSNFCFQHRLQEDHNCLKLLKDKEELLSKNKKPIVIRDVKEVKVRGAKNDALKLKVTVMKLKQKAKGLLSIPEKERIYFSIQNKINNSIHEYFFSTNWSIGKCIDYLSNDLNIKNNNDKIDQDKLILKIDNQIDYLDFERTIEYFILKDQCLFNGQQLVLCYQKL